MGSRHEFDGHPGSGGRAAQVRRRVVRSRERHLPVDGAALIRAEEAEAQVELGSVDVSAGTVALVAARLEALALEGGLVGTSARGLLADWIRAEPGLVGLSSFRSPDSAADAASEAARHVTDFAGIPSAHSDLQMLMEELTDNVLDHSRSRGVLAFTVDERRTRVGIAVADTGLGITWSLSDSRSAAEALGPRVSGNPRFKAGTGLFIVARVAAANGGRVVILTGNELVVARRGAPACQRLDAALRGTLVWVELDTRRPIDVTRAHGALVEVAGAGGTCAAAIRP